MIKKIRHSGKAHCAVDVITRALLALIWAADSIYKDWVGWETVMQSYCCPKICMQSLWSYPTTKICHAKLLP